MGQQGICKTHQCGFDEMGHCVWFDYFSFGYRGGIKVFTGCTRKGLMIILDKMSDIDDINLCILSFISDKMIIFAHWSAEGQRNLSL